LSPKGEFSNRLEQALDLSKNVLDQAKRDLGNSLLRPDLEVFLSIVKQVKVVKDVPKFPPFSFLDNVTSFVYDLSKAYTKGLVTNGPDGS
jgi:hypothetical protein